MSYSHDSSSHDHGKHEPTLIDPRARFADRKLILPAKASDPQLQRDFPTPPDCGEKSYKGSGRLKGRKALVTGGDSGIGRAVAIACSREGAEVAISYLPGEQPDADDVAKVFKHDGKKLIMIPGDLTDEDYCKKLVHKAREELGGLDLLVLSAGFSTDIGTNATPILDVSTKEFDRVLRTNVYANFFIVREAVPHLPPGSSIIFTVSDIVNYPDPRIGEYGGSKAFLAHYTKALSLQLVSKGIRVNGINPGFVFTPLLRQGGITTELIPAIVQQYPTSRAIGRPAQPVELAGAYVDLADKERTYSSGSVLSVPGA